MAKSKSSPAKGSTKGKPAAKAPAKKSAPAPAKASKKAAAPAVEEAPVLPLEQVQEPVAQQSVAPGEGVEVTNADGGKTEVGVGSILVFLGYDGNAENPILKAGAKVRLTEIGDENALKIEDIETGETDSVWPEEVQFSAEVADEVARSEAAAQVGAGKGKGMQAKKQQKMREALAAAKVQQTQDFVEGAAEGDEEQVGETKALALVEATGNAARLEEMIHNVTHTAAVQRAMQENHDALSAAKALVQQHEQTYFTLGGVLAHIYAQESFKSLGYDGKRGFALYCEKELGIGYRKAMYLMETYVTFAQIGVDESVLARIGWSKAKELARIGKKSLETLRADLPALLDYAGEHNRDELQDHVTRTYIRTETPAPAEKIEKVKLAVTLMGEGGNVVLNAIAAAQRIIAAGGAAGEVEKGKALEHICGEWSLTQDGVNLPLEDAVRMLERRYGVTLAVTSGGPAATSQEETEETERAAA